MKKLPKYSIALTALLLALCSCGGMKTKSSDNNKQESLVTTPTFNADSAYNYVAQQVAMGYRVPGTSAHKNTAQWLANEMTRHGADVIVQEATVEVYNGDKVPMYNIIAQFAPEKSNRILLAAHWDSRPYADLDSNPDNHRTPIDGANDGASGVGVLLEIARHLGAVPPTLGVDIILFDVEDYGAPDWITGDNSDTWALGSQYWATHPHTPGYRARYGILLDMVGAPGLCFYREYFSQHYAPHIIDKVWECADRLGYASVFVNSLGGAITDDHLYMNKAGVPSIDIIQMNGYSESGFFDQWHTTGDTMEHIDAYMLGAVGQTVMTVVYEEK